MYVIKSGSVQGYLKHGTQVQPLATLTTGNFFGEGALLKGRSARRAANVCSTTYSLIYSLHVEEHIDKLFDRPKTSSLAASISLMATEDMVPPVQQQRQGNPEQQRQSHIVQALEAEQQQQHRSPSTSAAAADDGASTSTLHRIAGHIAKRTVVLATDSVEQFKSTGIPAFWLAMLMVLGAVAIFLCCWCIAYLACMHNSEREAVLAAKRRKPHKRDRFA